MLVGLKQSSSSPHSGIEVGIDRFTLNRFLPIPILTDFENFNLTDTDTDTEN